MVVNSLDCYPLLKLLSVAHVQNSEGSNANVEFLDNLVDTIEYKDILPNNPNDSQILSHLVGLSENFAIFCGVFESLAIDAPWKKHQSNHLIIFALNMQLESGQR